MTLPRGYWTSRRPPLHRRISNWWWDRRWRRARKPIGYITDTEEDETGLHVRGVLE